MARYSPSFDNEIIFPSRVRAVQKLGGRTLVMCEDGMYEVKSIERYDMGDISFNFPFGNGFYGEAIEKMLAKRLRHPTIKNCFNE